MITATTDAGPSRTLLALQELEAISGRQLYRREPWRGARRALLEYHGEYETLRRAGWSVRFDYAGLDASSKGGSYPGRFSSKG